ncbi:MAG: (2Fe-2S)-binding protein [Maricaulaceae bacterium]
MIEFTVNGETRRYDGDMDRPLLWYLREDLQLTGVRFGCGIAQCGACTVYQDGLPGRACVTPMAAVEGTEITTIEGLDGAEATAVVEAWREGNVVQCGWCQSGQIMAATALLKDTPQPTDDDIDAAMGGNLCRCATYARIRDGVKAASKKLTEG